MFSSRVRWGAFIAANPVVLSPCIIKRLNIRHKTVYQAVDVPDERVLSPHTHTHTHTQKTQAISFPLSASCWCILLEALELPSTQQLTNKNDINLLLFFYYTYPLYDHLVFVVVVFVFYASCVMCPLLSV
jgi:hypothetical protein